MRTAAKRLRTDKHVTKFMRAALHDDKVSEDVRADADDLRTVLGL